MDGIWRALSPGDSAALLTLQQACYTVDGYYALPLEWDYDKAIAESVASQCVFHTDQIISAGWLRERDGLLHLRALVHPDHRGRGLGTHLINWAETIARQHKATALRIQNEALTDSADALYRAHGFVGIFAEEVITCALNASLPEAPFPDGITLQTWSAETAPNFYAAYVDAFSTRPNFNPPPLDEWISDYTSDDDFRPDLSVVARQNGQPVGYVLSAVTDTLNIWGEHCGYIDQVGVIPSARGQGLGLALTGLAMQHMAREGLSHTRLHVNINNPGAIHVYLKLGFTVACRRARYEITFPS